MKKFFLNSIDAASPTDDGNGVQSFLHNHANLLTGKRIALFASSGSSLISTSERDAASLVPDATFEESLLLTSSTLDDMGSRIPAWLEELSQGTETINIRFERQ